MIELKDVQKTCYHIARIRAKDDKHYNMEQNVKNLAGEVVEFEEAMTYYNYVAQKYPSLGQMEMLANAKEQAEDELADIIIYALIIAEHHNFQLETAVNRKIIINGNRAKDIIRKEEK